MNPHRLLSTTLRSLCKETLLTLAPPLLALFRVANIFLWVASLVPLFYLLGMIVDIHGAHHRDPVFLLTVPILVLTVFTTALQMLLRRLLARHLPAGTAVFY